MAAATSGFKVIIVGGGPVGLLAAHTLTKAGIDFVILERRGSVRTHQGSSIGLGPSTLRLLDQLDLLNIGAKLNHPLKQKYFGTAEGKKYHQVRFCEWLEELHGHPLFFVHREDLLDMLYNSLSEEAKAKVLTGKRISEIESDETKAVVTCEDGTSYEGDLILGADGVRSQVRKAMRDLALKKDPSSTAVDDEMPFTMTFRCMFGFGPSKAGPAPTDFWECHGDGKCTQTMVGRDKTWFFVYEKLEKETRERTVYSEKDKAMYADKMGDFHLTDTLKVRDMYQTAEQMILADLEEGTVKNYAWGRIVLAGDSANKQTPNAGNGFNCGAQDVAFLSNLLHEMLKQDNKDDGKIRFEAIKTMTGKYQVERRKLAFETRERSALQTRMSTFHSWPLWLLDRYIVPGLNLDKLMLKTLISPAAAASYVLNYLPENNRKDGTIPWKNFPSLEAAVAA